MPDSSESRLNRLEQKHAAMAQHLTYIEERLNQLTQFRETQIRLEGKVDNVLEDVQVMAQKVDKQDEKRAEERELQLKESTKWRRAMVASMTAVIVAFIGAAATIISSAP